MFRNAIKILRAFKGSGHCWTRFYTIWPKAVGRASTSSAAAMAMLARWLFGHNARATAQNRLRHDRNRHDLQPVQP